MDVAGTDSLSNEELQKEVPNGHEFRFGAGENSSAFAVSGLMPSWKIQSI